MDGIGASRVHRTVWDCSEIGACACPCKQVHFTGKRQLRKWRHR